MIKLKKLVFVFIISLLFPFYIQSKDINDRNTQFDHWYIENYDDFQYFLISKSSDERSRINLTCLKGYKYLLGVKTPYYLKKGTYKENIFYYQFDDNKYIEIKGNTFISDWNSNSVDYTDVDQSVDLVNKYKTLFQQMLNAKESLKVSAEDADGNKYSVSFSVKGLPEALMDFAERCGPEFQEFSGIKPNQKIEP